MWVNNVETFFVTLYWDWFSSYHHSFTFTLSIIAFKEVNLIFRYHYTFMYTTTTTFIIVVSTSFLVNNVWRNAASQRTLLLKEAFVRNANVRERERERKRERETERERALTWDNQEITIWKVTMQCNPLKKMKLIDFYLSFPYLMIVKKSSLKRHPHPPHPPYQIKFT